MLSVCKNAGANVCKQEKIIFDVFDVICDDDQNTKK
jgi:hypothetical protein